jgi:hypothetical protein
MTRYVTAGTAPNETTAKLWLELLKAEGIPAVIQQTDAISYLGLSPFGCRVLVLEEQLESARALLEAEEDD